MPDLVDHRARAVMLAIALVALTGCGRDEAATTDDIGYAVSFHALGTVLRPMVGPEARIHVLLPTGTSPHSYEPRPSDARTLAGARLLLAAGDGVDAWIGRLGGAPTVTLLELLPDSIRLVPTAAEDPHVWLDPLLVRAALPALAEALCTVDARGCAGFRLRASAFAGELALMTDSLQARFSRASRLRVVASGPFLGHWAHRFGLGVEALVAVVEGVDPSASHIRSTIRVARTTNGVVGQTLLPEDAARAVAEAARVPYVSVDPIGAPATMPSYRSLLVSIADSLLPLTSR